MKFIENLEGLFTRRIAMAKQVWALAKLEAALARLSLAAIIVNLVVLMVLALTLSITVMILIGYLVTMATHGSVLSGIVADLVLNILLMLVIKHRIPKLLNRLCFEQTRASLSNNQQRDNHDQKKPVSSSDYSKENAIARGKNTAKAT